MLAAFGWGPMSVPPMNAPRWVVGVCGLFFAGGGVVVVASTHPLASLAAGVVVVGTTVVCARVRCSATPVTSREAVRCFPGAHMQVSPGSCSGRSRCWG